MVALIVFGRQVGRLGLPGNTLLQPNKLIVPIPFDLQLVRLKTMAMVVIAVMREYTNGMEMSGINSVLTLMVRQRTTRVVIQYRYLQMVIELQLVRVIMMEVVVIAVMCGYTNGMEVIG